MSQPLDALSGLVETLAGKGLLDVLHVRGARGRRDVTYEPRWHGLAVPVGTALGPDGVRRAGVEHALRGPLSGTLLGGEEAPAVWYPVPEDVPRRLRSPAVAAQLRHLAAASAGPAHVEHVQQALPGEGLHQAGQRVERLGH
ncbi:DUF6177 family protein, partial [Nocardiopsis sp. RV163]|uniref:DUF6177 family protein n=1 Tax=Nocardiopsis sp. RV163 TaxID=1661388 RepID=UPI00064BDA35